MRHGTYSKNSTLHTAGFYYGINQLCPRCKNPLTTSKGKPPQSSQAMKESHKQKTNDPKVIFKPGDTTENTALKANGIKLCESCN